ncbi:MAG: hypothetical protein ACLUPK_01345 [Veillonella sp.]
MKLTEEIGGNPIRENGLLFPSQPHVKWMAKDYLTEEDDDE